MSRCNRKAVKMVDGVLLKTHKTKISQLINDCLLGSQQCITQNNLSYAHTVNSVTYICVIEMNSSIRALQQVTHP